MPVIVVFNIILSCAHIQALFNGMRLEKNPPRRLALECLYYDEVEEKKPDFPTMYLLKVILD